MEDRHPGSGVLERLRSSIDAHDLDALVGCFAVDYRNETPAHPARGFTGRERVRANWAQILGSVPDLRAVVVRSCKDDGAAWAEWHWSGTRPDGSALEMRGVTVLGVTGDVIAWARFYMEPVDADGPDVDAAVRGVVGVR